MITTNDLWPDFENVPTITSPRALLTEQANFLSQKTKNMLSAKVSISNTGDGRIANNFLIVAPLLKNYTYNLFTLYHRAIYYPCHIMFNSVMTQIADEEDLKSILKNIFNSDKTKDIISSLLGQSKEFSEN